MADHTVNGGPGEHGEMGRRSSAGSRGHAGSGFSGVGWALAGVAGVAALTVPGAQRLDPTKRGTLRKTDLANGWSHEPEVEDSM